MAFAARIIEVVRVGTQLEIRYIFGATPLPSTWQGDAITVQEADLPDLLAQAEAQVAQVQVLALLPLADEFKRDSRLQQLSRLADKTTTVDFTTPVDPIALR